MERGEANKNDIKCIQRYHWNSTIVLCLLCFLEGGYTFIYLCFFIHLSAFQHILMLLHILYSCLYPFLSCSVSADVSLWSFLSVFLSVSFFLFHWMCMRLKLHMNNLIFWLTGWEGVRAKGERGGKVEQEVYKPVGSQPCLEKNSRQMEGWRDINECGVLSRWYSSSLTFLSH